MSAPVTPGTARSLRRVLSHSARPTLLLHDPGVLIDDDLASEVTAAPWPVKGLVAGQVTGGGPWGSVVLALPDVLTLRTGAPARLEGLRTRAVLLWLEAGPPVFPQVRPEWPPLVEVDAHPRDAGAALTRLRFTSPAILDEVVSGLVRDAGTPGVPAGLTTAAGLVLSGSTPTRDGEVKVPADVALAVLHQTASDDEPSPVTGRSPVVVTDPGPGPVDEGLFNPIGFRRDAWRAPVRLGEIATPITPATVAGLRDRLAVTVDAESRPADGRLADVLALAASGVPLVHATSSQGGPIGHDLDDVRSALPLLDATDTGDLHDPLTREEASVRLRRAAMEHWGTLAWRDRLGERVDVRTTGLPTTSVLLATRRPDLLAFALTQVAKQRRHGGLELVLAAHGFTPDPAALEESGLAITTVEAPAGAVFGEVLNRALAAASGDVVLKMDDDDWYGPDVVRDLLDARRWSGAELVGMPAEMVYLEPVDLTIRRKGPTESYGSAVAGGTMMLDRVLLRELGGFRPLPRSVDAALLPSVRRVGGRVYRTQGLGYLLRRTAAGHTWNPDLGYFLRHGTVDAQWRGFRPSRLLDHEPHERPEQGGAA